MSLCVKHAQRLGIIDCYAENKAIANIALIYAWKIIEKLMSFTKFILKFIFNKNVFIY